MYDIMNHNKIPQQFSYFMIQYYETTFVINNFSAIVLSLFYYCFSRYKIGSTKVEHRPINITNDLACMKISHSIHYSILFNSV